jgi:hypothetical protein
MSESPPDKAEVAAEIATRLKLMADRATGAGLPLVAYLLDLVRVEAEREADLRMKRVDPPK